LIVCPSRCFDSMWFPMKPIHHWLAAGWTYHSCETSGCYILCGSFLLLLLWRRRLSWYLHDRINNSPAAHSTIFIIIKHFARTNIRWIYFCDIISSAPPYTHTHTTIMSLFKKPKKKKCLSFRVWILLHDHMLLSPI
jgi:hypothetical protein